MPAELQRADIIFSSIATSRRSFKEAEMEGC